jgi:hypothetical protein
MSHMDHDHTNSAVSFQFMIEGSKDHWPLRATWKEAAADAVSRGMAKWASPAQTSIYLQDRAQILRIPRSVPRRA